MPKRITLKEIARATRLHITTVSMALRDDPRIRVSTRQKVVAAATRLGYVPDPMLKALSAYRTSIRPHAYQATLAWINNSPQRLNAKATGLAEYHAGARARAEELGYLLEDFWTYDPAMGRERLMEVLRYRNISGLLLAPQPRSQTSLALPWEHFSVVTFGYSLITPQFHAVTNHQFRTMRRALGEIRALGYRRIGLWLFEEHDRRVAENWSAGFLTDYQSCEPASRIWPFLYRELEAVDVKKFSAWLDREKPQVVVTGDARVRGWLQTLGRRVPADIGLSMLSVDGKEEIQSGTYENSLMIGAAAVDFLVGMLHRHEKGVPTVPHWLLVDSIWHPGRTLRRIS